MLTSGYILVLVLAGLIATCYFSSKSLYAPLEALCVLSGITLGILVFLMLFMFPFVNVEPVALDVEPTQVTKTEGGFTVVTYKGSIYTSDKANHYISDNTNLVIREVSGKNPYGCQVEKKYSIAIKGE